MADDSKPAPTIADAQLAALALGLIDRRRAGATICPSAVARAAEPDEARWRALMPRVREVAARLADAGLLRATQRGREVDARSARGAVRLGRPTALPPGRRGD